MKRRITAALCVAAFFTAGGWLMQLAINAALHILYFMITI